MPARHLRAFLLSATLGIFSAGCAAHGPFPSGDAASPAELMESLFPAGSATAALRSDGEITLRLAGRSVSLPGTVQLRSPGGFRLDLLDPFDRPAAVIFSRGDEVVQYRPAASEAAAVRPLPQACPVPLPDWWVAAVLGGMEEGGPGDYHLQRTILGRPWLARLEGGAIKERIDFRFVDGQALPERITWYCRDEAVLRLEMGEFRLVDGVRLPGSFTVLFPQNRFSIEVTLGEAEYGPDLVPVSLAPVLASRTRWTRWTLTDHE